MGKAEERDWLDFDGFCEESLRMTVSGAFSADRYFFEKVFEKVVIK